jgi:lysozyme
MKISPKGVYLIKTFEGCKLNAYLCSAKVQTIGYGHTGDVKPGDTITQHQAEELLIFDLERFEVGVNDLVKVEITQNQFDALVSLAFNIGLGNFKSSTLLRMINAGDANTAGPQFPRWNKAAGKVNAGLTRRRAAERDLYNTGSAA